MAMIIRENYVGQLEFDAIFRILSLISDGFLDDIALPNVGLELEWERQKQNKSYMEEVEKYKKEILMEGLQVTACFQ